MPIAFLAPLFLAGLIAVAVPVWVHLTHKQRKEVTEFPSLMFIEQVPFKAVKRRRLRHILLFAMRALAIILLVAAFARPLFDRPDAAALGLGTAREVVILLDRSWSMGYGDTWERALEAAAAEVEGLGPDDLATLVFFDDGAAAAMQPTGDRARLRAALDTVTPGSGTTRFAPALRLARSILDASELPRREAVLISDLQRSGWGGEAVLRLPPGAALRTVSVAPEDPSNVSVTSVELHTERFAGRERATVTARLTNRGTTPAAGLPVTLELEGRTLQTQSVELAENDATTLTFEAFTVPETAGRGIVRAGSDALAHDDAFHFMVAPDRALPVLVVEAPDAPASTSLYLTRALEIGQAPGFQVDVRRGGTIGAADLAGRAVVVLNDAPFPGGEAGRRLRAFVEAGGGLVLVLGERSAASDWSGAGAALLPGTAGRPADRTSGRGGTVGYLDYAHPALEVFAAPRSGDFSAARFYRYRPLTVPAPAEPGAAPEVRVLARLDDGAAVLTERLVGRGRVLALGSTVDGEWNDLPLQPVFLPFAHRVILHAAGYAEARPWFTTGQVLDLAARAPTVAEDEEAAGDEAAASAETEPVLFALAPSGERVELGVEPLLTLTEAGFYEVRSTADERAAGYMVAANPDPAEAELTPLDPGELVAAVEPADGERADRTLAGSLSLAERERRQSLWWYLLVAAFALLAAETVLSNRLSRAGHRVT